MILMEDFCRCGPKRFGEFSKRESKQTGMLAIEKESKQTGILTNGNPSKPEGVLANGKEA